MVRLVASALSVLAFVAAGCSTPPANLDTSLKHATVDGKFIVSIQPPAAPPAINQMHSWRILVSTPGGAPVSGARIAVDGGMPQHGHGLPTRPQVTPELGEGAYQLDGMKFSMTGWWEIKLVIQASEGIDKVTFNTVVTNPATVR